MSVTFAVIEQIIVMFLLMLVGVFCFKRGLVDNVGKKQLSSLLVNSAMPLVVLNAYINSEFDSTLSTNLLYAFLLAFSSHIIVFIIAFIFINKKSPTVVVDRFSIIYSNSAFMAIPLIDSVFGVEGVFYSSAYVTIFNLLVWTHGYIMFSGKTDKKSIIKAFTSPIVISLCLGLIIYFNQINVPPVISSFVRFMASINSPIAMIIMGINMAQINIISLFKELKLYYTILFTNFIPPIVAIFCYFLLPISTDIIVINLIALACPTAVTTVLFANQFDFHEHHASKIVTLSNIVSIFSIPFIIWLFYLVR